MAAPVDPAWPKEGTVWRSAEDVLLACQLAACKVGFSSLDMRRKGNRRGDDWCTVQCIGWKDKRHCMRMLVHLQMVDRTKAGLGWQIQDVKRANLEAARHPRHMGVSSPLRLPQPSFTLRVGDTFTEGEELHLLEAALRIDARNRGRYLAMYVQYTRDSKVRQRRYFIACVNGHGACSLFVRLSEGEQDGEFVCTQVDPTHTCRKAVEDEPGRKLRRKMAIFPAVTLEPGLIGDPQRVREGVKRRGGAAGIAAVTDEADEDSAIEPDKAPEPSALLSRSPTTASRVKQKIYSRSPLLPLPTLVGAALLPARSPSSSTTSTKTSSHHSKGETNAERKERRRKERAQRTGVEETKEERAERRTLRKERKAMNSQHQVVDKQVKKPASTPSKVGADVTRLAPRSIVASTTSTHSIDDKTKKSKKLKKTETKEQKQPKPTITESSAEKVKPRKQAKSAAGPIRNLPVPFKAAHSSAIGLAASPKSTASSTSSKMFLHHGKLETNHERKERRRKEREQKTGVIETQEERQARRAAEKQKKRRAEK